MNIQQLKWAFRNFLNLPIINPLLLDTFYLLGIRNKWISDRFYRLGPFSRNGIRMFGTMWDPVASTVFLDGIYGFEPEMSRTFASEIRKGMTVLDIGAHIGYYSILSAIHGAKVYAFEPNPMARNILVENIALNNADVTVLPVALSDTTGEADLYIPAGGPHSGARLDNSHGGSSERVKLLTLDQFTELHGISSLDLIKLDVEQHEARVLKGGVKTISRFRPVIYIEILADTDTSAIEKYLPRYKFEHLTGDGPIIKDKLAGNNIWRNYRCIPY